jgi:hypothetical protein
MKDSTLRGLARTGYIARGVVYVTVGGLAIGAAAGHSGMAPDGKGAMATILSQPFGFALLIAIGIGLVLLAVWRLAQAILDADQLGSSMKGALQRSAYGVGALVNVGLAFTAVRLGLGLAGTGKSGDATARDWTASVLAVPAGRWLIGVAGLTLICAGLGMAAKGWRAAFDSQLAPEARKLAWVRLLGRLGYLARGLAFVLAGGFVAAAALHANSREARGLAGALKALEAQPYGSLLLGLTGIGLLAFGLFQFALARYRRISTPHPGP